MSLISSFPLSFFVTNTASLNCKPAFRLRLSTIACTFTRIKTLPNINTQLRHVYSSSGMKFRPPAPRTRG